MDLNLTKDPYARRYLREVKTTTTKFIANSGCILGFCMGFSLISGAEVVFHIVAGLFTKKRLASTDALQLKEQRDRKKRSYKLGNQRRGQLCDHFGRLSDCRFTKRLSSPSSGVACDCCISKKVSSSPSLRPALLNSSPDVNLSAPSGAGECGVDGVIGPRLRLDRDLKYGPERFI